MKKGFIVFNIVVLFFILPMLFPSWLSGASFDSMRPIVGFKDIYLGDNKEFVLSKLNKYNSNYKSSVIELYRENIDPYFLMSKEFSYKYKPSYLLFDIDDSSYYIDFKDVSFFHNDFNVSFNEGLYVLYYTRLSNIAISSVDLKSINPYLKDLSFHFFSDSLYKISYSLNLSLAELERFLSNFSSLYGKPSFVKSGSLVLFEFAYEGVIVRVNMAPNTFSNLGHLDLVERASFLNQRIGVSIEDSRSLKDLSKYKRRVYYDMLDMFNQKAQGYLNALIAALENTKDLSASIDSKRDIKKYKYVDDLSG